MEEVVVTQDVLRATVFRSGPPTCVSNDVAHEMIQAGWSNGGISVYRPIINEEMADVFHWSSFPAHRSAVLQTYGSYGTGIYSVSSKAFKIHSHGGADLFSLDAPNRTGQVPKAADGTFSQPLPDEFRCFTFTSATRVALGTMSGRVWDADLQYGRLVTSMVGGSEGARQEITKIRTNERSLVSMGLANGYVRTWDFRVKNYVDEFQATTGGRIVDMDASGDYVVTCGLSNKNAKEPFLRVFDMRIHKQLTPIQFLTPLSLRFLPEPFLGGAPSSNLLVVSANGNLRLTDIRGNGSNDTFGRVQTGGGNVEALAVSCTGRSFSLMDSAGYLHFWSANIASGWNICDPQVLENQPFLEVEHPRNDTSITALAHPSYWMVDEPCGAYPMPFHPEESYSSLCSSDFPPALLNRSLRNTHASLKIHPKLMAKVTQRDYIGYITNVDSLPGMSLLYGKDNQGAAYVDADPREPAKRPLKENMKSSKSESSEEEEADEGGDGGEGEELAAMTTAEELREIKRRYMRPDIAAAQVTISECNFSEVNSTQFAGLEADFDPNSFINAPLQALYFLPEFRKAVLSLPFSSKPVCMPTETSILFRLLDMSRRLSSADKACQARSFHRAFRLSPDALALGLLEPSKIVNDRRAGAFVRFLFTQFLAYGGNAKSYVEELFGLRLSVQDTREVGGKREKSTREISSQVVDLNEDDKSKPFEKTLEESLRQERKHRSWDDAAKTYANVTTVKSPVSMPPYLVLNCAELFEKREEALGDKYFCESFGYEVSKSKVVSMRGTNEPPPGVSEVYDVVAVLSRITDVDKRAKILKTRTKSDPALKVPEDERAALDGHLVLHVKVQDTYDQSDDENLGKPVKPGTWLLFNDIAVALSDSSEALKFSSRFRAPAVLIFKKRTSIPLQSSIAPRFSVDSDVFLTPSITTASKKQNRNTLQHNAASLTVPKVSKGDIIAIDCEFVALSNDVYDVKPDGARVVVAPARRALARVSCLTSDGRVMIDDYVAAGPEPIVDYLTRFSGLVPSDLDPAQSTRHLLPHRIVYSKLLYLIDIGCIFVGHGLKSDFRVVNVIVPPDQVRDTSALFWLRGQRMLSLKYLSSMLLQEDIQDRVHDSIQDAKAALKLYNFYFELEKAKKLDETVTRLYLEGPTRNWS